MKNQHIVDFQYNTHIIRNPIYHQKQTKERGIPMYFTKINVSNGTDGAELTVDSSRTLRSVLEEAGVNYSRGLLQYNGTILGQSALDSTIEEVTDNPDQKQILRMTVKADNAAEEAAAEATAVVVGGALVITSSATPDEIATIRKYRPNALKLMEGEGAHKEQIFMIGLEDGPGSINKFGAMYSKRTDKYGKATITINIPEEEENPKAWAEEMLGVSILHLRKTEKQFAAMLDDVKQEKAAVAAAISVA